MKIYSSFSSFGSDMGVRRKARKPFTKKCHKCGAVMNHVEGTNVYICPGMVTNKNGQKEPCENYALSKR